jgi:hypothetical protein
VALSAAPAGTCAILAGGVPTCWGSIADPPAGLPATASLSHGDEFACALDAGGLVRCWGGGSHGELGSGSAPDLAGPVEVLGLASVTSLASGGWHSCAVADGSTRCWGWNGAGGLGDGTGRDRAAPVPVAGLAGAVAVTAGRGIGPWDQPFECGQAAVNPD